MNRISILLPLYNVLVQNKGKKKINKKINM